MLSATSRRLPIAILILGLTVRSYRHMALAFNNLILTITFAWLILYPIALVVDINSFAPVSPCLPLYRLAAPVNTTSSH